MRRVSMYGLVVLCCLVSLQVESTPRRRISNRQRNFLKAEAQLARRAVSDAQRKASRLRTASQAAKVQVLSAQQRARAAKLRADRARTLAMRYEKRLHRALPKLKRSRKQVKLAVRMLERREELVRRFDLQASRLANRSSRTARDVKVAAKNNAFHTRQVLMELRRAQRHIGQMMKSALTLHRLAKQTRSANHKARLAAAQAMSAHKFLWGKRQVAAIASARAAVAQQLVRIAQFRMKAARRRMRR